LSDVPVELNHHSALPVLEFIPAANT